MSLSTIATKMNGWLKVVAVIVGFLLSSWSTTLYSSGQAAEKTANLEKRLDEHVRSAERKIDEFDAAQIAAAGDREKLANIAVAITEIKNDLKEIKSDLKQLTNRKGRTYGSNY